MNIDSSRYDPMILFRNTVVLAAFALTTIDFFRQFSHIAQDWSFIGHLLMFFIGLPIATVCGTLMAHLLLSLWRGTPFLTDLIDHEPEPIFVN